MRATRRSLVLVCVLVCLGLLASACGDKKKSSSSGSGGGKAVKGGTITLAAEQEPDCTD